MKQCSSAALVMGLVMVATTGWMSGGAWSGEAEFTMLSNDGYQMVGVVQVPSAWSGTPVGVINKSRLFISIEPFGSLQGKFRLTRAEQPTGGVVVLPGPDGSMQPIPWANIPMQHTGVGTLLFATKANRIALNCNVVVGPGGLLDYTLEGQGNCVAIDGRQFQIFFGQ